MSFNVENWEPEKYVSFLNSENHPDRDYESLKVVRIGNGYVATLHTGYGLFTSPMFVPQNDAPQKEINKELEKMVEVVKDKLKARKDANNTTKGFLTF